MLVRSGLLARSLAPTAVTCADPPSHTFRAGAPAPSGGGTQAPRRRPPWTVGSDGRSTRATDVPDRPGHRADLRSLTAHFDRPTCTRLSAAHAVNRLSTFGAGCCRFEPCPPSPAQSDDQASEQSSWREFLGQRRTYSTSVAALATRHGEAMVPMKISGWSALAWAAVDSGRPFVGVITTVALAPNLRGFAHPLREPLQIAGKGNLRAGRYVADTSSCTRRRRRTPGSEATTPCSVPLAIGG